MGHEPRHVRQDFPIRRLVAATMRCAQEDQTECLIFDRLIQWLDPCLE